MQAANLVQCIVMQIVRIKKKWRDIDEYRGV
jgi:hypothetical protein